MDQASIFYTIVPNAFGSSKWNFLPFTLLAPTILKWLIKFWKVFSTPDVRHHCRISSEMAKRRKLHAGHYSAEL